MTPENDRTTRGLFHSHRIGRTEWNDRREYRTQYEGELDIGQGKRSSTSSIIASIISGMRELTMIHDHTKTGDDDHENYIRLERFFPESKLLGRYLRAISFGYGVDKDGNGWCDCCGRKLHLLNSDLRGLCSKCDLEVTPNFNDSFGQVPVWVETLGLEGDTL